MEAQTDRMEHIRLDVWQEKALNTKGHMLLCTGRQSGKTFLMARKASDYMLNNPRCRIIVVSLTEDQAQLMIIMILDYLERYHKIQIAKGHKKPTKRRVFLKNGAMVLARPVGNTGDAVRGFTGDVLIVDEASRMPEMAFTAAKPTLLTTGGEIWMCSTPFGKEGYFYECYLNKHDRFTVIRTNSEEVMKNRPITEVWTQARREGAMRILEEEKKDMSELQYAQEYLGEFLDDLRRWFSDKWIEQVCSQKRRDYIRKHRNYYLGVDIARMGEDLGSYEIIDMIDKDNLVHVENITTKKQLTTQTEDRILQIDYQYEGFRKIYLDAGSGTLGVSILDHLMAIPQTRKKVVAINSRQRVIEKDWVGRKERIKKARILNEDLYDNLRSLGEKGKIKLLDDEDVQASLRSVQYQYMQKEGQPTRLRIFGNDTHIAEGLIRAAWCVKEKVINIAIHYI